MKLSKINLPIYFAILMLVFLVYIAVVVSYESIMKSDSDYGVILNNLIIGLATIFQYPSALIISETSNGISHLIGLIINLSIYSLFTYCSSKWILRKIKSRNSN